MRLISNYSLSGKNVQIARKWWKWYLQKFFSRWQDDRFDLIEKIIYLFSNRPIDAVCGSSMTRSLSSFQENKLFESFTKCTFRLVGLTSSFGILYSCLLIFTFWYKTVVFSQVSEIVMISISIPWVLFRVSTILERRSVQWMILSRKDPSVSIHWDGYSNCNLHTKELVETPLWFGERFQYRLAKLMFFLFHKFNDRIL